MLYTCSSQQSQPTCSTYAQHRRPYPILYTCTSQQSMPKCSTHAPHNNHSPHALHMHSTGGPAPFSIHAPHISQCPNALHMHLTAIFIIGVTQWCYHSIYYHVHCKRNSEEKRKIDVWEFIYMRLNFLPVLLTCRNEFVRNTTVKISLAVAMYV